MSVGIISAHDVLGTIQPSYDSVVLADGPLAYYKLDETSGTVATDYSGNGRDGTYLNNPILGAASLLGKEPSGKAMSTTADSNQCMSVPFGSWMNVNTFTVEGWAKFTAYDGTNGDPILSRYTAADNYPMQMGRDASGSTKPLIQLVVGGTRYNVTGPNATTNGRVYYMAATYDGATIKLYLDGDLVASVAATGTVSWSSSPFEVARYSQSNATVPAGTFDAVAFYGTALSAARIAAHYNAGASYFQQVLSDNPHAYYRMDDISGSTMVDVAGASRNGAYFNAPTLAQPTLLSASSSDKSVRFNGTNQHAQGVLLPNVNGLTVEFLCKAGAAVSAWLISNWNSASVHRFALQHNADGSVTYANNIGGTDYWNSTPVGVAPMDGTIHHIAHTFDGATQKLYVDGSLQGSAAHSGALQSSIEAPYIARVGNSTANMYNGWLDEIAFWGSALTAAQIADHAAAR